MKTKAEYRDVRYLRLKGKRQLNGFKYVGCEIKGQGGSKDGNLQELGVTIVQV